MLLPVIARGDGEFKLWKKSYRPLKELKERSIYVYLPPNYQSSKQSYPVVYMHDGQNLFDPSRAYMGQTWNAQNTLNYYIQRKLMEPVIVVAIDTTPERVWELTPTNDAEYGKGGGASTYLKMMTEHLIPEVEKSFRAKTSANDRAIIGSSLGGLISIYSLINNPGVFNKVAALSPSTWWDERVILDLLSQNQLNAVKIWIDCGTKEVQICEDLLPLRDTLIQSAPAALIKTRIEQNADHSEIYWAARLPAVLMFLFTI